MTDLSFTIPPFWPVRQEVLSKDYLVIDLERDLRYTPRPALTHPQYTHFCYNSHNNLELFTAHGEPRSSPAYIEKLIFPEHSLGRKAEQNVRDKFRGQGYWWCRSQLAHYGIVTSVAEILGRVNEPTDFWKRQSPPVLQKLMDYMRKASEEGKFAKVPEYILEIEKQLSTQWKRENRSLLKATKLIFIKEFEARTSPRDQLEHHVGLFMRKYFLDEKNIPDEAKSSNVISFFKLDPVHRARLRKVVKEVGGVHIVDLNNFISISLNKELAVTAAGNFIKDGWEEEEVTIKSMHETYLQELNESANGASSDRDSIEGIY
jgi:hypothetical protein